MTDRSLARIVDSTPVTPDRRWWREYEVVLLALLVSAGCFARLSTLSIRGEESRRGRVACEMLETGDWIVPRQQGVPYLSRPPLGSWPIAAIGALRGQVDAVAVRLPSAIAVLLTTLLIYAYARGFLSRLGAFAAAAAFATMPQVLELGRLGETEAVFTLLVSSSLLVWHWGYTRAWPQAATWMAGHALAALAGLDKGPQGPIYFVAPVLVFLALRRDGRFLFGRGHLAGLATFAVVLGAWQIPFFLATDWHAVKAIWCDNAATRFADHRLLTLLGHLAGYPLEILGCTLPWSLLLAPYAIASFRRAAVARLPQLAFSAVALAVAFPTVWLAATAKGRYFMPLYPCLAVLIGVVVEFCGSNAFAGDLRPVSARFCRAYFVGLALAATTAGSAFFIVHRLGLFGLPDVELSPYSRLIPVAASVIAVVLVFIMRKHAERSVQACVLAAGCVLAMIYAGVLIDLRVSLSEDSATPVARIKAQLPAGTRLTSFDLIDHLFAFHFRDAIDAAPWPADARDVPDDVEYFCFNDNPPGSKQLPFAWERLTTISFERQRVANPQRTVVVGRRLRQGLVAAAAGDASRAAMEENGQ